MTIRLPFEHLTDQKLMKVKAARRFLDELEADGHYIDHDWEREDGRFISELAISMRDVLQYEFAKATNQIH